MPRRKNPPSSPAEPTRRSTRSQKKRSIVVNDSSEDELSVQSLTTSRRKKTPRKEEVQIQDEIVAYPLHKKETPPPIDKSTTNTTQEYIADEITVQTCNSTESSDKTTHNKNNVKEVHSIRPNSPVSSMDTLLQQPRFKVPSVGNDEDELTTNQPAIKKPKVILKNTEFHSAGNKKGRSKWDDPEEMLTNPNAPLARAELRNLLCSPRAWDILSPEEKQQVLAKFPDQQEILNPGTEDARPDVASLRNNNNFRHDIARYQEDLAQGRHDPEWIRQALAAHRKRELGLYDEFLDRRFVEDWGTRMPQLPGPDEEQQKHRSSHPTKVSGSMAAGEPESEVVVAAVAVKESEAKARASGEEEEEEQEGQEGQGCRRQEAETLGAGDGAGAGPAAEAHGPVQVRLGEPLAAATTDEQPPAATAT